MPGVKGLRMYWPAQLFTWNPPSRNHTRDWAVSASYKYKRAILFLNIKPRNSVVADHSLSLHTKGQDSRNTYSLLTTILEM